jgi:hypothetical protein
MNLDIDFTKYSIEELRELENKISHYIFTREDGFIYICRVRLYGSVWEQILTNELSVNDLCNQYDGEHGIVDVYTTNPNAKIENDGEVNYVFSKEDYEKWKNSEKLHNLINSAEKEIERWNNRNNVSFNIRPSFAPIYTEEDILGWRNELELLEWTYEEPVSIKKYEDYE